MTDEERKQFINEYCRNVAHKPMTKLCNTCEYLRYCARSGIEEVGCDRYQKDTTTNEEWLRSATTEQLAEFLFEIGEYDWLKEIAVTSDKALRITDIAEWLKQPHHSKE